MGARYASPEFAVLSSNTPTQLPGAFASYPAAVLPCSLSVLHALDLLAVLLGYGFAWIGHFFFEHNRPATFKHPLYSFAGDWVMYWQMITGRVRL